MRMLLEKNSVSKGKHTLFRAACCSFTSENQQGLPEWIEEHRVGSRQRHGCTGKISRGKTRADRREGRLLAQRKRRITSFVRGDIRAAAVLARRVFQQLPAADNCSPNAGGSAINTAPLNAISAKRIDAKLADAVSAVTAFAFQIATAVRRPVCISTAHSSRRKRRAARPCCLSLAAGSCKISRGNAAALGCSTV